MVPVLSQLRCLGKKRSFLIAFHLSVFPHKLLHQGSPQSYIACSHYLIRTSAGITFGLWCILPSTENTTNWVITIFLFQCFPHRTWSHIQPTFRTWQECLILCGQPLCSLCHILGPLRSCKIVSHHTTDKRESERSGRLFYPPITITSHFPKKKKWQKILMKALFILEVNENLEFFQKIYLKITPQTKRKNEYSLQLKSHTR